MKILKYIQSRDGGSLSNFIVFFGANVIFLKVLFFAWILSSMFLAAPSLAGLITWNVVTVAERGANCQYFTDMYMNYKEWDEEKP